MNLTMNPQTGLYDIKRPCGETLSLLSRNDAEEALEAYKFIEYNHSTGMYTIKKGDKLVKFYEEHDAVNWVEKNKTLRNCIEESVDFEYIDDVQIGGNHYKSQDIQPWDYMEACMTEEQFIGYLRGNVIKYVSRYDKKGGIQDIDKALQYLNKLRSAL